MTDPVRIGDGPLTLEELEQIVYERRPVTLAEGARERVAEAAAFVAEKAGHDRAIYGVTTGFGANRNTIIDPAEAEQLQLNLIMSHACGVGAPFPTEVVRAMLALRINALAQGYSGARPKTLDLLAGMLNRGVHPIVPEHGSVGASGDLCPLAHLCLPVVGLGEAEYGGERLPGAEALTSAGLEPIRLTFKEGLALLNGTQAMTALGFVALYRLRSLFNIADAAAALSLDAVGGRSDALDPKVHELRRRRGQIEAAGHMRALIAGSELVDAPEGRIEGKKEYIQDSYCLRCAPQVHGACRDVVDHVAGVLFEEANAVTDNPLVFVQTDQVVSGGNEWAPVLRTTERPLPFQQPRTTPSKRFDVDRTPKQVARQIAAEVAN